MSSQLAYPTPSATYDPAGTAAAAVVGLVEIKGSVDCSSNPNYPSASKGDRYRVSVAGKIGGASGTAVDVDDEYTALADNAGGTQAAVGSSWHVTQGNVTVGSVGAVVLAAATEAAGRNAIGASAGIFPSAVLDLSGVTSTPRLLPLRDIVSILADSANTHYERHPSLPSVIQLKALTLGTIADAIATVPAGATLTNGSALASATASGDTLTMNHATSGGGEFYGGDGSAPNYNWTYTRGNGKHGVVFHMAASDIDTAGNGIRVGIATSAGNVGAMLDFYNGGTRAFRYIVNGTTSATIASRSQAEVATGTWCWIEYDEAAATIALRYKHASNASEPADAGDWTLAHRAAVISSTTSSWLRVIALTNGSSGTYVNATVTGIRTYGERAPKELPGSTPTPTRRSFGGFAPAADPVAIGHVSETSAWLPDLTLNRLALADAVNRVAGDAGTVTWALVGSDTSLAACVPFDAGSYATAASVVRTEPVAGATITTAKLYWKLWVKVVSASGLQTASIDLARIPGLYAA